MKWLLMSNVAFVHFLMLAVVIKGGLSVWQIGLFLAAQPLVLVAFYAFGRVHEAEASMPPTNNNPNQQPPFLGN